MKLTETTVIRVDQAARTARHVEDFPNLGEARAAARKLGRDHETLPAFVWHLGVGWFEWSRSRSDRRGKTAQGVE